MNHSSNTIYIALKGKNAYPPPTNPEPVFEISIDPIKEKVLLEKMAGKGFLRFNTTYVAYVQKGEIINIAFWSIKNKRLLGTLTNKDDQWSREDLLMIVQELKNAGVQVREKRQDGATSTSPLHFYDVFPEAINDNTQRGKSKLNLMWTRISLVVLSFLMALLLLSSLIRAKSTDFQSLSDVYRIYNILQYIIIGVALIELIVFLFWLRRAYANLIKAGCHMRFADNYVAWSFFIPFIWWIHPYVIMKEIWQNTQWKIKEVVPNYRIRSHAIIQVWWAANLFMQLCFVILIVWVIIVSRQAVNENMNIISYVESLQNIAYFSQIIRILGVLYIFIFPIIFTRIIKQEKRLYKIFLKLQVDSVGQKA